MCDLDVQRAIVREAMALHPSHPSPCLSPIIGPGVPIGRPVGAPIGARAERSANAWSLLILFAPHTKTGRIHKRITVLRFIERQGDRTCHLTRHGDECACRDGRGVKKLLPQCDEPTLGGAEIRGRLKGASQWQLEDFDSGSFFEPARSQHFASECDGLSVVGLRGGFHLRKGQRRRAGRERLSVIAGEGTAGDDDCSAEASSKESVHGSNYNKAHMGSPSVIMVLAHLI
jgi:hypothetical protein